MTPLFLPEAVKDIDRLYNFLIDKNPLAAQKAMLAIDDGVEMLLKNPYIGKPMDYDVDYRQYFVSFGRACYVLRYRIEEKNENLVVIRIWHSREDRT